MSGPIAMVERADALDDRDLDEICAVTEDAIVDGDGFGWIRTPARPILERYWKGVLLVPERTLLVARLDGEIVGTLQLIRPPPHNEAGNFAGELTNFVIRPRARGFGLARWLLEEAEVVARADGMVQLDAHIRADREAAITLIEEAGYRRWGTKERYARIGDIFVAGHFYSKMLDGEPPYQRQHRKGRGRAMAGT